MSIKLKTFISIVCLLILGIGSAFIIFKVENSSSSAMPMGIQTSQRLTSVSQLSTQSETSVDIGAHFDKNLVQLKYVSFAPVLTKSEAIAIAKKQLHDGFNWDTNNLPADATVALFSGHALPTSTRSATIVNDVQAWIVVVKDIPFIGSGGPPPLTPSTTSAFRAQPSWQFNLAIDATTGEDLDSVITSMPVQ